MATLTEKWADAKFSIQTPLCHTCKNHYRLSFDSQHPAKITDQCHQLGEVPEPLRLCASKDCEHYSRDDKLYELHKDIL